jgi:septal ring factor EnvC (AmiA/AmiB activator)
MAWIFFTYYISNYMVIHTGVPMTKLDVTPEATQRRISKIESEIGSQQETVSKINHDLLEAKADLYALEEDLDFWRGE